jgi:hypothetical protein
MSQAFAVEVKPARTATASAAWRQRQREQRTEKERRVADLLSNWQTWPKGHRRSLAEDQQHDDQLRGHEAVLFAVARKEVSLKAVWGSLLDMPIVAAALGNVTIVRGLLERTPVLRASPAVKALDEEGGWDDPDKVSVILGGASSSSSS